MACGFCRSFPLEKCRELSALIEEGKFSLGQLAERYKVSVELVEEHYASCYQPTPLSGYELLGNMLTALQSAAEAQRQTIEAEPDNGNAMASYIDLTREVRSTVQAMDRVKPTEELARDILQKLVNPLVQQCVTIVVEEVNRMRSDLVSVLGSENYKLVDKSTKSALSRVGSRLKGETDDIAQKLPQILSSVSKVTRDGKKVDLKENSVEERPVD